MSNEKTIPFHQMMEMVRYDTPIKNAVRLTHLFSYAGIVADCNCLTAESIARDESLTEEQERDLKMFIHHTRKMEDLADRLRDKWFEYPHNEFWKPRED